MRKKTPADDLSDLKPINAADLKIVLPSRRVFRCNRKAIVFNNSYPVPFNECDTPTKLLGWVAHLSEKEWMTAELIGLFIEKAAERNGIDYHGGK